jgi:hypothetical protein
MVGYVPPIGNEEGVVLRKRTLIEYQHEFRAIRSQPLDGVRESGWKVPKVTFAHIADKDGSIGIQNGDASVPVQHIGPLVRCVPMELPKAARCKPHSDCRNIR